MKDFRDKVVVITGAGSGIGRALALGFAAEGSRVVAADIDGSAAQATAAEIGDAARAHRVDVADPVAVQRLADDTFADLGRVDVLINNAGVFQGGYMWDRSLDDWAWIFGVNVWGIVHAVRSFVPRMIAQGSEGHIVNTSSVAAFVSAPASSPYVVSKCAAFSLSECLAHDLAAAGSSIGVSVLTPSAFDTAIATTSRVRGSQYATDSTPDGAFTAEALAAMTAAGRPAAEVVAPVLAGIRSGEFLIATKPSYHAQVRSRMEALLERRLPPYVTVD